MVPKLPAVLLMGGGEGMGPVKKTAKALGESFFDKEIGKPIGQLIIICGRNKDLVCTRITQNGNSWLRLDGFRREKWMCACDSIITKVYWCSFLESSIFNFI